MAQYVFGTGQLFTAPIAGGVPLRFGALQDVSVDFTGDIKTLHGQYQFPLDTARGKAKVEGSAKTGEVNVAAFNTFYFGQDENLAAGQYVQAINEAHAVPASPGPYTVSVDHDMSEFYMDLGVYNATTGAQLTQVESMPATGEYSVSAAGVYTFNSMDADDALLFNYLWHDAMNGNTLTIGNPLMGITPRMRMVLSQIYGGKTFTLVLFATTAGKLTMPLKQDDYLISDLSFSAFANDANEIGFISTTG